MEWRTIGQHNRRMQGRSSKASHILPDLLQPGLDIVFCGTAPGVASAQALAYYAKPGNKFWRVLHETGLTPVQIAPENYPQLLTYGLGLTDLCKTTFGQDKDLPHTHLDRAGLRRKILKYKPRYLAFTSLQGVKWYLEDNKVRPGLQTHAIGTTQLFALPSTSGLATNHWNIQPWQELANLVRSI